MKRSHGLVALLLLASSASLAQPRTANTVVEVGRYRLQSNLWVNLHQYLDGKVSREAATRQILIETAPPKKSP